MAEGYWADSHWASGYWGFGGTPPPPVIPPTSIAVLPPRRRRGRPRKQRLKSSVLVLVRDYLELKLRQKQND